jgi:hypothetical protein
LKTRSFLFSSSFLFLFLLFLFFFFPRIVGIVRIVEKNWATEDWGSQHPPEHPARGARGKENEPMMRKILELQTLAAYTLYLEEHELTYNKFQKTSARK